MLFFGSISPPRHIFQVWHIGSLSEEFQGCQYVCLVRKPIISPQKSHFQNNFLKFEDKICSKTHFPPPTHFFVCQITAWWKQFGSSHRFLILRKLILNRNNPVLPKIFEHWGENWKKCHFPPPTKFLSLTNMDVLKAPCGHI